MPKKHNSTISILFKFLTISNFKQPLNFTFSKIFVGGVGKNTTEGKGVL